MQRGANAPFIPINRMMILAIQECIYYQPEVGMVFKINFKKNKKRTTTFGYKENRFMTAES